MNEKRSDIEVLIPDGEITLADEEVVRLRALPFGEAMALRGKRGAAEYFGALEELVGVGEAPNPFVVLDLGTQHLEWWLAFLGAATGLERDRIVGLDVDSGTALALEAVRVNAGFFGVSVQLAKAKASAGRRSSPPSSDTDTPDRPI